MKKEVAFDSLVEENIFLSLAKFRPNMWCIQTIVWRIRGDFFSLCEADCPPLDGEKNGNAWKYTFTVLYTLMTWRLLKNRDKFICMSNNKIMKVLVQSTLRGGGRRARITYEIPKGIFNILSHFLWLCLRYKQTHSNYHQETTFSDMSGILKDFTSNVFTKLQFCWICSLESTIFFLQG